MLEDSPLTFSLAWEVGEGVGGCLHRETITTEQPKGLGMAASDRALIRLSILVFAYSRTE